MVFGELLTFYWQRVRLRTIEKKAPDVTPHNFKKKAKEKPSSLVSHVGMLALFLSFAILLGFSNRANAQITYDGCAAAGVDGGPYTLNLDVAAQTNDAGTIRNTYTSTGYPTCGAGNCRIRIIWSIANSRWEVQFDSGPAPFSSDFVLYTNTNASFPNPPDLTVLGGWTDAIGCGAIATLTGDVQTTLGGGDTTPPRITSITRESPTTSPTNAYPLVFKMVFDEDVQNVDASDFDVTGTTGDVTAVSNSAADTYFLTVSGGDVGSMTGTVTLTFNGGQNIQDLAGNALANLTPTGTNNNTYDLDNTPVDENFDAQPTNNDAIAETSLTSGSWTFTAASAVTMGIGGVSDGIGRNLNAGGGKSAVLNINAAGVSTFGLESASGGDFAMLSFDIEVTSGGSTSATIRALRDGGEVVAGQVVDLTTSGTYGNMTYSHTGTNMGFDYGTLTFNASYNNIDELEFVFGGPTGVAFDNIDIDPAVAGDVTPPHLLSSTCNQ